MNPNYMEHKFPQIKSVFTLRSSQHSTDWRAKASSVLQGIPTSYSAGCNRPHCETPRIHSLRPSHLDRSDDAPLLRRSQSTRREDGEREGDASPFRFHERRSVFSFCTIVTLRLTLRIRTLHSTGSHSSTRPSTHGTRAHVERNRHQQLCPDPSGGHANHSRLGRLARSLIIAYQSSSLDHKPCRDKDYSSSVFFFPPHISSPLYTSGALCRHCCRTRINFEPILVILLFPSRSDAPQRRWLLSQSLALSSSSDNLRAALAAVPALVQRRETGFPTKNPASDQTRLGHLVAPRIAALDQDNAAGPRYGAAGVSVFARKGEIDQGVVRSGLLHKGRAWRSRTGEIVGGGLSGGGSGRRGRRLHFS